MTNYRLFKKYKVNDVETLEEFNKKYYKPSRYDQQGEEYMKAVLKSQREEIEKNGFTIISKHDNVTGDVVAFYPETDSKQLVKTWIKIGNQNPWIKRATDPEFNESSFYECKGIEELKEKLLSGNWCLGQAFYLDDICFINQVNAGDEWLVIKGDLDFESLTAIPTIKKGKFEDWVNRVREADEQALRLLEY